MDSSSGEELGKKLPRAFFFSRFDPTSFFENKSKSNGHPTKISWISYQFSEVYIFCIVGVASRVPQRSRRAMRIESFFVVDLIEALLKNGSLFHLTHGLLPASLTAGP